MGNATPPAGPTLVASKLINISKHKFNRLISLHFHNKRGPLLSPQQPNLYLNSSVKTDNTITLFPQVWLWGYLQSISSRNWVDGFY